MYTTTRAQRASSNLSGFLCGRYRKKPFKSVKLNLAVFGGSKEEKELVNSDEDIVIK
jgi:hypothetical protein